MVATIVAIYGAVLSTALAVGRLAAWLSSRRRRLIVRLFISPLVVDEDGQARVQNEQGHPAVQEGEAAEFLVIRCQNPGRRAVKVARVDLVNSATGQSEHLTWLLMPTTIEPEEVQLWYSKIVNKKYPHDVFARVTLTDGVTLRALGTQACSAT